MPGSNSKTTTSHAQIRRWAEARGARPARVRGTGRRNDPGMIRLDFPGYSGAGKLQEISWDQWFDAFDENQLALVYQERTAGGNRSNFNKLVARKTARARARGDTGASRRRSRSGASSRTRSAKPRRRTGTTSRRSAKKSTSRARSSRGSASRSRR